MPHTIRARTVFTDREFPLRVMRVPAHSATRLHGHEFHELVIILAGRGLHLTGRGAYPLEAGDVFVIRGGMAHGYRQTEGMNLVNILFSPRRLQLALNEVGDVPGYHALFHVEPELRARSGVGPHLRLGREDLDEAVRLATALEHELEERRPGYRLLARSHLLHLVGFLSRCYSNIRVAGSGPLMEMGKILSHLEQHVADPVSVRQLARMAGMSETTFMRRFRLVTGHSPIDHLIRLRIDRACELLHRDDLRVTDVAFRCGFEDSNYFSRQFRRVMGCSPRSYRRGH